MTTTSKTNLHWWSEDGSICRRCAESATTANSLQACSQKPSLEEMKERIQACRDKYDASIKEAKQVADEEMNFLGEIATNPTTGMKSDDVIDLVLWAMEQAGEAQAVKKYHKLQKKGLFS